MTLNNIAAVAQDANLQYRLSACAAMENLPDPAMWVSSNIWKLAARPGWGEAYSSSASTEPGKDDSAITDAMIVEAVQALAATP